MAFTGVTKAHGPFTHVFKMLNIFKCFIVVNMFKFLAVQVFNDVKKVFGGKKSKPITSLLAKTSFVSFVSFPVR